jgi:hypothetical protein
MNMLTDADYEIAQIMRSMPLLRARQEKRKKSRPTRRKKATAASATAPVMEPEAHEATGHPLMHWARLRAHQFGPGDVLFLTTPIAAKACWGLGLPATSINPGSYTDQDLSAWFRDLGVSRVVSLTDMFGEDEKWRKKMDRERKETLALRSAGVPVWHWLERDVLGPMVELLRRMKHARLDRMPPEEGSMTAPLSYVRDEPVEWIWPGRITRGKLTLIAGDPGVGKSFLTLDIAARVTRGLAWPDGTGTAPTGRVLVLSSEDDAADTVKPRLTALGGDVNRVSVYQHEAIRLHETDRLKRAIEEAHADLVIVDPIAAYFPVRLNINKDSDVRRVLEPLAELAREMRVGMVLTRHLTKDAGRPLLTRVQGSIAFIGVPRNAWGVDRDGDRSVLVSIRQSLVKEPEAIAFRITDGRLVWDAEPVSRDTVSSLRGEDGGDPVRSEAATFLRDFLADGPHKAQDVISEGSKLGFSRDQLLRAKRIAGVKSRKQDRRAMASAYEWYLDLPAA